jgi:hypothetical protein
MALPIPRLAPVTSATLPLSKTSIGFAFLHQIISAI